MTQTDIDNDIERVIASWTKTIEAMPGADPRARVMAAAAFFSEAASRLADGYVSVHMRAGGRYLVAAPGRGTVDLHGEADAETVRH